MSDLHKNLHDTHKTRRLILKRVEHGREASRLSEKFAESRTLPALNKVSPSRAWEALATAAVSVGAVRGS
jgi:hypothetical protein